VAGNADLHENLLADFAGYVSPKYGEVLAATCDGQGMAELQITGNNPGLVAARCPRCERDKLRRAIAGFIPRRFREPVEVPPAITEWAGLGRKAEGLYLAGPVGTGKTHAAWMAVSAWCIAAGVRPRNERDRDEWHEYRARPNVIFQRMTDMLDDFRPGADGTVQYVRDCQDADLLVIDDLGAEKPSEWTQERLYSVVDHRYANCRPLIVTGNLPPAKLAEQTGDRVASRLAQMCQVVPMTGPDRRYAA
jgi:DNA replication protein DnaC